jgi:very-short-patch-repair endonuclease
MTLKCDMERAKCESPIEVILYDAMQYYDLAPKCQHKIGHYRVDFAFVRQRLIVEADGQHWHKGWRKRKDNKRDKWLRNHAWEVLRFTGKEIYNSPFACAHEIMRALQ